MDRRFLGILGGIIIIFVVIFVVTSGGSSNNSSGSNSANATSHIEGQGKAGVTLVEYGDYQCPVCESYYQPLKDAVSKYMDQIHFQFRNLPITSIHPNAYAAARAAEAAALQGKYWQMHDKLYENQNSWADLSNPKSSFDQYAHDIGLNMTKFDSDYAGSKVNDAINADAAAFSKTGQAIATPTFFLDGKVVDNGKLIDNTTGVPSADKIGAVIKAEINKKSPAAKQ